MKNFDIDNYQRHLRDLKIAATTDPFLMTTYLRGAFDIANSFNTEESASGILSRNDMIQECYLMLCKAWNNLNWDAIQRAQDPKAHIWAYLKKTISLDARNSIHDQKDGVRIPHGKRWEINETKNVDDFLSQLFPTEWFAENDERLDLIEYGYNTRYDIEQLGLALQDVFNEYLTFNERYVIENSFGLDGRPLKNKDIAKTLKTSEANVRKIKERALKSLKNDEIMAYLKEFYEF